VLARILEHTGHCLADEIVRQDQGEVVCPTRADQCGRSPKPIRRLLFQQAAVVKIHRGAKHEYFEGRQLDRSRPLAQICQAPPQQHLQFPLVRSGVEKHAISAQDTSDALGNHACQVAKRGKEWLQLPAFPSDPLSAKGGPVLHWPSLLRYQCQDRVSTQVGEQSRRHASLSQHRVAKSVPRHPGRYFPGDVVEKAGHRHHPTLSMKRASRPGKPVPDCETEQATAEVIYLECFFFQIAGAQNRDARSTNQRVRRQPPSLPAVTGIQEQDDVCRAPLASERQQFLNS
jgi:hypothetical protein